MGFTVKRLYELQCELLKAQSMGNLFSSDLALRFCWLKVIWRERRAVHATCLGPTNSGSGGGGRAPAEWAERRRSEPSAGGGGRTTASVLIRSPRFSFSLSLPASSPFLLSHSVPAS